MIWSMAFELYIPDCMHVCSRLECIFLARRECLVGNHFHIFAKQVSTFMALIDVVYLSLKVLYYVAELCCMWTNTCGLALFT